jgi:hypothetical protein
MGLTSKYRLVGRGDITFSEIVSVQNIEPSEGYSNWKKVNSQLFFFIIDYGTIYKSGIEDYLGGVPGW